jgi:membrane protein YdbS with pleckstrin-like domain
MIFKICAKKKIFNQIFVLRIMLNKIIIILFFIKNNFFLKVQSLSKIVNKFIFLIIYIIKIRYKDFKYCLLKKTIEINEL